MKATPLIINWHHDNNNPYPIYSAHFEPNGKGRLATGAGDNNVRVGQCVLCCVLDPYLVPR
jgi:chromatin assembly factor 1 subunit B